MLKNYVQLYLHSTVKQEFLYIWFMCVIYENNQKSLQIS